MATEEHTRYPTAAIRCSERFEELRLQQHEKQK
jgi:hypothetical protein